MVRRSKWTASIAAALLAIVAVLGIVALGGTGDGSGVSADTPTPTPSPSPTPPFAFTIACTPNPTTTGTTVTCAATQTTGTSGTASTYIWTFGDNSSPGGGNPVTHVFTTAGSFMVQATAIVGSSAPTATTTVVVSAALSFTITASPTTATVGQQVTFTVTPGTSTTFPSDTTFAWTFNDGTQSVTTTTPSITHQFPNSGTFTVSVTATTVSGATNGTNTLQYTVTATSQQLTLSLSPLTATAGQSQNFSVSATGTVPTDVVYTINWGDGTGNSTGSSAPHTYANAGTFSAMVSSTSSSNPASNTSATFSVVVSAAQPTGPTATYGPGWNLVGGPTGTTFTSASGVLYTYQAGDTAYRSQQNTAPITGGLGYWAYFTATTTVALNGTGGPSLPYTGSLPANQYVMVGNPSNTAMVTVSGADVLYIYDAVNGYQAVTTLKPGQGGWAFSTAGGSITMR